LESFWENEYFLFIDVSEGAKHESEVRKNQGGGTPLGVVFLLVNLKCIIIISASNSISNETIEHFQK
jgi:hypothetical protein